jgi:hypothetical protein
VRPPGSWERSSRYRKGNNGVAVNSWRPTPLFSNVGIYRLNSSESRMLLEARGGIEPPSKGFADLCLTTWLPRLEFSISITRTAAAPHSTRLAMPSHPDVAAEDPPSTRCPSAVHASSPPVRLAMSRNPARRKMLVAIELR